MFEEKGKGTGSGSGKRLCLLLVWGKRPCPAGQGHRVVHSDDCEETSRQVSSAAEDGEPGEPQESFALVDAGVKFVISEDGELPEGRLHLVEQGCQMVEMVHLGIHQVPGADEKIGLRLPNKGENPFKPPFPDDEAEVEIGDLGHLELVQMRG